MMNLKSYCLLSLRARLPPPTFSFSRCLRPRRPLIKCLRLFNRNQQCPGSPFLLFPGLRSLLPPASVRRRLSPPFDPRVSRDIPVQEPHSPRSLLPKDRLSRPRNCCCFESPKFSRSTQIQFRARCCLGLQLPALNGVPRVRNAPSTSYTPSFLFYRGPLTRSRPSR